MTLRHIIVTLLGVLLIIAPIRAEESDSLIAIYDLDGTTSSSSWTTLTSVNPNYYADDPWNVSGSLTVNSPGYSASSGLYSWSGPYSVSVSQQATNFDIQQAVFQIDAVWDPESEFPINGGPKLSYNGGNQELSPLPMILHDSEEVDNGTGIPDTDGLDSFVYRGATWQWDLSAISEEITSITITLPLANHTSVRGIRVDVASKFTDISDHSSDEFEDWKQTHFGSIDDSGSAASDADPDHDGLSNLLEFALGTDPNSNEGEDGPGASPKPEVISIDAEQHMSLSFKMPAEPSSALVYTVSTSSDLATWTTLASKTGTEDWIWNGAGSSMIQISELDDRDEVTVTDEAALSNHKSRFMRLEIAY
ncbi:hypothetical protein JIN85_00935 [Luteolibacter pohnpeiensis]|uniref:Uncharacterized protein n=1 Tax=Luteolibacter pohnpeiensis TaxID=454153 RepID=A0A934VPF8_9BACT|nr:hypothetical protein [Luteolibacter pohnpeiensis]MBK1880956.1 hypothetical protein [Luteolibacter pohnpeiensis]